MDLRHCGLMAPAICVCVLGLSTHVTTEQRPAETVKAASGLLRSEVSLAGHTLAVTFAPSLKADDPAHRGVLSPGVGSANARVRVAQLVTISGTLRIGALDLPKADPPGQRHDLWLEGTGNGWKLQVTGALAPDRDRAAPPPLLGEVELSRQASAVVSPTFGAALIPTSVDAAQLVLRWGGYTGTTEVKFVDPPVRLSRVNSENGLPNVGVTRGNFDDTGAHSREQFLSINNETVIELPNGKRLSASFSRSSSPPSRPGQNGRPLAPRGLNVGSVDYSHIASAADGAVIELTESAVPRLKIETPLRFGKITVRTENQVGGFPGVYGMWLKRHGNGWRLVLNSEYDVWGTQHDRKFDVAEIDLTHSEHPPTSRPFGLALVATKVNSGRLIIVWGPHEWTADFVVAG